MIITNPYTKHKFFLDLYKDYGINEDYGLRYEDSYYKFTDNFIKKISSDNIEELKIMEKLYEQNVVSYALNDIIYCIGLNVDESIYFKTEKSAKNNSLDVLSFRVLKIKLGDNFEWKEEMKKLGSNDSLLDTFEININTNMGIKTFIHLNNRFPEIRIFENLFFETKEQVIQRYPYHKNVKYSLYHISRFLKRYQENEIYRDVYNKGFGSIILNLPDKITYNNMSKRLEASSFMKYYENITFDDITPAEQKIILSKENNSTKTVAFYLLREGFKEKDIDSFENIFSVLNINAFNKYKFIESYLPQHYTVEQKIRFIKKFIKSADSNESIYSLYDKINYLKWFMSDRKIKKIFLDINNLDDLKTVINSYVKNYDDNCLKRLKEIIRKNYDECFFITDKAYKNDNYWTSLKLISTHDISSQSVKQMLMQVSCCDDDDILYLASDNNGEKAGIIRINLKNASIDTFLISNIDLSQWPDIIENKYLNKFRLEYLNKQAENILSVNL